MERTVIEIMKEIGVSTHIKGYRYLLEAVLCYIKENKTPIMKIYSKIAKTHNKTLWRVERDMRYAIEKSMDQGEVDVIYEIFGDTISPNKGKPTVKGFITTIAYEAKLRNKIVRSA